MDKREEVKIKSFRDLIKPVCDRIRANLIEVEKIRFSKENKKKGGD